MAITIHKVNALPAELQGNAIYLIQTPNNAALFDMYVTNADGSAVRHVATRDEILASTVLYSPTPPALPNPVKLWWNTEDGSLNIQYEMGETSVWVEAMPSIAVPEFAGTGEANTMARSDHHHDETYIRQLPSEW